MNRRAAAIGRRTALGLPLATIADAALAHHGFEGRYDISRPIYLDGFVRSASFRPPHPTLSLAIRADLRRPESLLDGEEFARDLVVREEDRGRTLDVEFPPVRLFFDMAGRLAIGERIAIVAYRNCSPPSQLRGQWVRLADGTTFVRKGRMQSEVRGCS